MDLNHFHIVADSLAGNREVDEQTLSSAAILSERLEQLKKSSELFSGISLSPQLSKLTSHKTAVAVC